MAANLDEWGLEPVQGNDLAQPDPWGLEPVTPPLSQAEARLRDKMANPGFLETASRSLGRGSMQLAESAGAGMQYLGNRLDSPGLAEFGDTYAQTARDIAEASFPRTKALEGNILEQPELLLNPKWWAETTPEMIPSLAAAVVPGVAAARALNIGGKVIGLTPKVAAKIAALGGAVLGGGAGGALEGTSTYRKMLEDGYSEPEAARAGEFMTGLSAILNAIPLSRVTGGLNKGIVGRLGTGVAEAITEWLEGPAEEIAQAAAAKDKDLTLAGIGQSLKDEANVAPPAFLLGMLLPGGGRRRGGREAAAEPSAAPAETGVEDLIGSDSTDGQLGVPGPTLPANMPLSPEVAAEVEGSRLSGADRRIREIRDALNQGRPVPPRELATEIEPEVIEAAPLPDRRSDTEIAAEELASQMRPAPPAANIEMDERQIESIEAAPAPDAFTPPETPASKITVEEIEQITAAPAPLQAMLPAPKMTGVFVVDTQGVARELSEADLEQSTARQREQMVRSAVTPPTATPGTVTPPPATDTIAPAAAPPTIDTVAHEAATSPQNDLPVPTDAQKEAGNYKKGHTTVAGQDIAIENPAGSRRRPKWPELKSHYGYFKRTEGKDGDQVDVFVKPGTAPEWSGPVFVVDQNNKDGEFDEHKVMLGFKNKLTARTGYLENYTKGWKGLGAITEMTQDEFKAWLGDGKRTKQPAATAPSAAEDKRADTARLRAMAAAQRHKKESAIDPAKDDLLAAIAKAGGISREAAAAAGIDPAEFTRRGWKIQRVFTTNGRTLEGMSEYLAALRYPVTNEYGYGENPMLDALDNALRGQPVMSDTYEPELDEREYADLETTDQQRLLDAMERAREAGVPAEDIQTIAELAATQGYSNEEAIRLLDEEAGQYGRDARPGSVPEEREERPRAETSPAETDARGAEDEAIAPYTAADLAAREQQKKDAEKARQQAEQRAQADDQRGGFTLTGSDRDADVGAAAGQQDLLAPRSGAQASIDAKRAQTATKIDDFGEKIGAARKDVATSTTPRRQEKPKDDAPTWRRRFSVSEVVKSSRADDKDVGRFVISDSKDPRSSLRRGQTFATREEAEAMIPLYAVALKHSVVGKTKDGGTVYEIIRKVTDRKRVKVIDQDFATREDAMRYMADHAVEIIETKTSFGEEILALSDAPRRQGPERRQGDATAAMFSETFGFRGVEFGNWQNQLERQEVMNAAYDGLVDLAEILNIPPKAISLNGDLALAFGARGHGLSGARAHYERDRSVINLTKMHGSGALSHEWLHALDHYFGRQEFPSRAKKEQAADGALVFSTKGPSDYLTHGTAMRDGGVRPEVRDAYTALVKSLFSKAEQYVEDTAKVEKFLKSTRDDLDYQIKLIRDGMARDREWGAKRKAATPEQLAAFDALVDKILSGDALETEWRTVGEAKSRRSFPPSRWTNDTLEAISVILKDVTGRGGFSKQGGQLDTVRSAMQRYAARLKQVESAKNEDVKTRQIPTDYAMAAKVIDQGRATDYWTTPHEMLARAFSAYVEDKVAESGQSSEFLSFGSDNKYYRVLGIRPFPEGVEREAIRTAFDKFIGVLETQETDAGTMLFARQKSAKQAYRWNTVTPTANGPLFVGDDLTLWPAAKFPNTFKTTGYWVLDADNNRIGVVTLRVDGDQVTDLYWIHNEKDVPGFGTEVLARILANTDTLAVHSVLPDARGFWDKVGSYDYTDTEKPDATLDWDAFSRATDVRRLGEGSGKAAAQTAERRPRSDRESPQIAPGRGLSTSGLRTYLESKVGKAAITRLLDSGEFVITTSQDAKLPPEAKAAISGGDVVYGFTDQGKTYLLADNLSDGRGELEDGYAIFLHEVGTHYGLPAMLGKERFGNLIGQLKLAQDADTALGRAARRARAQVPQDTPSKDVDEETLAWLVTDRANHELPLVQRIIARIRAWLVSKGFTRALSADALVYLARGAAVRASEKVTTRTLFARDNVTSLDKKRWKQPETPVENLPAFVDDQFDDGYFYATDREGSFLDAYDTREEAEAAVKAINDSLPKGDVVPLFARRAADEARDAIAPEAEKTRQNLKDRALSVVNWIDSKTKPLASLEGRTAYLTDRYLTLGRIAKSQQIARNIYTIFRGVSDAQGQKIYAYLTDTEASAETITDPLLREEAVKAKALIEQTGQALVQAGVIPQESFEAYQGRYLPRVYLAYLLGDKAVAAVGTGKTLSQQGYAKKRNENLPQEYRDVILGEIKDPAFLASRALGLPLRDLAILNWMSRIADNPAWALPGQTVEWTAPGFNKPRKVTPFWLKTQATQLRDRAQYYEGDHKQAALRTAGEMDAIADQALSDAGLTAGEVPAGYSQIPNTARYGAIRGLVVKTEIYDDIVGVGRILGDDASMAEKVLGYGGVGTKVTQLFKWSKVAANPPAQIRNIVSNLVLLNLSGVPLHKIPGYLQRAIHELRLKKGTYYAMGQKYGVTESTFAAQELFRIEREVTDMLLRKKQGFSLLTLKDLAGKFMDFTGDAYQLAETAGKMIKMMDAVERQGKNEADAALEAQDWLFDYSLVGKNTRYLRNAPIGFPFLTFTVKVLPRLLEVAVTAPWRFAPYMALFYGAGLLAQAMLDVDDDDLEALKQSLPEWLREKGHAVLIPIKDEHGRWQYADLGYFMPWTFWTELVEKIGGTAKDLVTTGEATHLGDLATANGLFGGPIPNLIAAITTGVDPFTKREIAPEAATAGTKLNAWMTYLYGMAMPTWLVGIPPFHDNSTYRGAAGHLYEAITGMTDRHGEPRSTVPQAIARFGGVNIYPIEPMKSRQKTIRYMDYRISEVKRLRGSIRKDRSLKPEERKALNDKYNAKIQRMQAEKREYMQKSQIPAKLR